MAAVAPHNWMPPGKQPWYFVAITLKTTNNSVIITPDHPLILDNTPLSMLFISSYHQSYGINVPKTHPRGSCRGSSYLLWLSISFGATTSVDRWYLAHKLTTTKHGRIFTVPSNLFHSKWLQWHKIVEQNGPTVSSSIILVSPRCRLFTFILIQKLHEPTRLLKAHSFRTETWIFIACQLASIDNEFTRTQHNISEDFSFSQSILDWTTSKNCCIRLPLRVRL